MLNSETIGQGPDVIFLHGLFGAGDNWRSVARQLSDSFRLHLIDLPNHGRSAWIDNPTLQTLAQHVNNWITEKGITQYRLLGHSMGGKVAMEMALNNPIGTLEQLIVVDIAPVHYPPHHQDVFTALNTVNFDTCRDRKAVELAMRPYINDEVIRQFLLKSLYKKDDKLAWRFNYKVLEEKYDAIACPPQVTAPYNGPTLFIKGKNSHYIKADSQASIIELFPHAKAKIIEGAGHWPHAEKPIVFTKLVKDFLKDL